MTTPPTRPASSASVGPPGADSSPNSPRRARSKRRVTGRAEREIGEPISHPPGEQRQNPALETLLQTPHPRSPYAHRPAGEGQVPKILVLVHPLASLLPLSTQPLGPLFLPTGLDPLLHLAPLPAFPLFESKLFSLPAFPCSYIPWRCSPSLGAPLRPRYLVLGRVHRLFRLYTLLRVALHGNLYAEGLCPLLTLPSLPGFIPFGLPFSEKADLG